MSPKLISNIGYIGIALQAAKGTKAVSSDYFIKYNDEGFTPEFDTEPLREGGDDELIGEVVKNQHREKFTLTARARPELVAYAYAWLLGNDTKTGSVDPFTHIITRGTERGWLTIRRKIDTDVIQVLIDAKIEKLTIEAEAGKPVMVTFEGNALTADEETVEEVPVYEDCIPFMFYHGKDNYKINSVVTNNIKKFTISYTVASQEGLQTDDILLEDLPDIKVDVDCSFELYAENTVDFWKKVNYNNEDTPQEGLFSFAYEQDLVFTENVANDRQFKINIGKVVAEVVPGINLKGDPEAEVQTLAGIAIKPAAGELFTVTVKNDISTDIISNS